MKTYRRHNCADRHTTWAALAACVWPAATVTGNGPYAALTCQTAAVTLYTTPQQATNRRRTYDRDGCGPNCGRRHQTIALDPTPDPRSPHAQRPPSPLPGLQDHQARHPHHRRRHRRTTTRPHPLRTRRLRPAVARTTPTRLPDTRSSGVTPPVTPHKRRP